MSAEQIAVASVVRAARREARRRRQNVGPNVGTDVLYWFAGALEDALADPDGALAKHDAEVLRAAADDYLTGHYYDHFRKWLRERADRIAGDQP